MPLELSPKVSVQTSAPVSAYVSSHVGLSPSGILLLWSLPLLALSWPRARDRKRIMAATLPILLLTLSLTACGGSGSLPHTTPGTPTGTYTITVTATSGALSHDTALKVVIQ